MPLCLGRATYEKRKLESGDAGNFLAFCVRKAIRQIVGLDETAVQALIEVIEHGINMIYEGMF